MVRGTNQVKALAAYREKQKRIAALLSRIQDKLAKHTELGSVVNTGHQKSMLPFWFHHTGVRRLQVKGSPVSVEFVAAYRISQSTR